MIIAIAGKAGSGKTYYANKCCTDKDVVISFDGYHYSKNRLKELIEQNIIPYDALSRRGSPWTYDLERFYREIKNLKMKRTNKDENLNKDEDLYFPFFDHTIGDPIENYICVNLNTINNIYIEGLYVLNDDLFYNI